MASDYINQKEDRELIEATIRDLMEGIDELEGRIQFMHGELTEKKQRLDTWRRKLVLMAAHHTNSEATQRHRRPKGENLRSVLAALQDTVKGLAASEIQKKTDLPWSSIQATLKRNTGLFVETNGLWKLRNPQNGSLRGAVRVSFKDMMDDPERFTVEDPDAPELETDEEGNND